MQINFENSRLAYVDAYSYILRYPEEYTLETMNKIVDMVYRNYSEYNRQVKILSKTVSHTVPFRKFLSEDGFTWDSQLSKYTNYDRFIGAFRRFVTYVVDVANLNEAEKKELESSFFNNIDEKVCRFVSGKIRGEKVLKLIDSFDRVTIMNELPYQARTAYIKDLFLKNDIHLKADVLRLQGKELQSCYDVLYQLFINLDLEDSNEFNRAISTFLPDRWSTSVDFYRKSFTVNREPSLSRLDEAELFLLEISSWLKKGGSSPFKTFLVQEQLVCQNQLISSFPKVELEHKIRACMEVFYLLLQDEESVRNAPFSVSVGDIAMLEHVALEKKIGNQKRNYQDFLRSFVEAHILTSNTLVGRCLKGIGAQWNNDLLLHENYNEIKKAIYGFFLILYKGAVPENVQSYCFSNDIEAINKAALEGLYDQYTVDINMLSGPGAQELRDFHKDLEESHEKPERKVFLTLMKLEMMQDVEVFKGYKNRLEGMEIISEYDEVVHNIREQVSELILAKLIKEDVGRDRSISSYSRSLRLNSFLQSIYAKIQKKLPYDTVLEAVFAKRDLNAVNWLLQKALITYTQNQIKGNAYSRTPDRDFNDILLAFSLQEIVEQMDGVAKAILEEFDVF